jgi:hypothetical protein
MVLARPRLRCMVFILPREGAHERGLMRGRTVSVR